MEPNAQLFTRLEQQYWQAIKDRDLPLLLRLTDDPCVVAGSQGVATVDHTTYSQMLNGAKWKVVGFSLTDVQVRIAAEEVALVAYKVTEELEVEGQPITLHAADTSVWIRKNEQWVCTLHTESVLGDPYGRDRR